MGKETGQGYTLRHPIFRDQAYEEKSAKEKEKERPEK